MTSNRRIARDATPTVRSRRSTFAASQRALALLVYLTAALVVLVARPAAAMVLAPMCGGNGETLTAPPITRNAVEVPLAPTGCERKGDLRFENRTPNPAPPQVTSTDVVPRLPPVWYRLPSAPCVLVPVESTSSGERAGFGRGIERPPR